MNKEKLEKAVDWLGYGEHGLSSMSMCVYYLGGKQDEISFPSDPSDFQRCVAFMTVVGEKVPTWMSGIGSFKWDKLVENWDNLLKFWNEEKNNRTAPKLYEAIKKCI